MSALLGLWFAAAWTFAACYRPVKHSRKVAYLTLASFLAVVMTLAMVLFGPSSHTRKREANLAGASSEVHLISQLQGEDS
jgi:hypothetical protein